MSIRNFDTFYAATCMLSRSFIRRSSFRMVLCEWNLRNHNFDTFCITKIRENRYTLFLLFFGAIYYGDEVLVRKWIKRNFVYLMRRAMQQSCFHLKIIHCSIIVLHFGVSPGDIDKVSQKQCCSTLMLQSTDEFFIHHFRKFPEIYHRIE